MDRNPPMTDDKLYTSLSPNTIMAKLTNHVQRTRLKTSSTDKHYPLVPQDDFRSGCRNVSHQQQFFSELPRHPDDHTIRTTDTPGFKPFTIWLVLVLELQSDLLIRYVYLMYPKKKYDNLTNVQEDIYTKRQSKRTLIYLRFLLLCLNPRVVLGNSL